jgi:hypothetical protein
MPQALEQSKYREQVENNIDLRNKMRRAFILAEEALRQASLGSLDSFDVTIDGINLRFISGDSIRINDEPYDSASPRIRKEGYDRLEKFMKIAIERYNDQFNI